jgi:flagellar basal-body rod protein FlgC
MFQQAQEGGSGSLFADQEQAGRGVQVLGIVEDQSDLVPRYEPDHPAADGDGYVYYPNVTVVEEMADMISASRSFQTNVEMMNTAKQMLQRVLTLGQ